MALQVLSVGGSIIVGNKLEETLDIDFITAFMRLIHDLIAQGNKFLIFVGGGKSCRIYMNSYRKLCETLQVDEQLTDTAEIGMMMTAINASLLMRTAKAMGINVYPRLVESPQTVVDFETYDLAFGCGLQPGHSTDYDTIIAAHAHGASVVVNFTNVAKVYDKDPKVAGSKTFDALTWDEFRAITGEKAWFSGMHTPFDPLASEFAAKHTMTVVIAEGTNLANTRALLTGQPFVGTIISPTK